MPFIRPTIKTILAYIIVGFALIAIMFAVISISTTHWIHTIRMRAGFWKLCHLQPLACFNSVERSPAALSLVGLFLILIGLTSTFITEIIDCHLSSSIRSISVISVFSFGFGAFFLSMSYVTFSRVVIEFCYSYYLMIVGHIFAMIAAIMAGYLEGQRNTLVTTSITMSRLGVNRP